jgi:hypothetical protein
MPNTVEDWLIEKRSSNREEIPGLLVKNERSESEWRWREGLKI